MSINGVFRGAEATIMPQGKFFVKERSVKSYRLPQLDTKLRKQRTKKEVKLLLKSSSLIDVPAVISNTEYTIVLEKIKGKKLASCLDKLKNKARVAKYIGKSLAKLHDSGIIHGDLTTSNMIYSDKKVYFIDFGLGFESQSIEDKAVDLHVLKEALEARHHRYSERFFISLIEGYGLSKNASAVLKRLEAVEKRGRYKTAY